MEDGLGDLLHCEEQLRNTLHNNDKEKLRQKLELLQREHRRTFQRLRRAEHLDSVRGRTRSKISQHSSHEQTEAEVKPCPSVVERNGTKKPDTAQDLLSPASTINTATDHRTQADTADAPMSDSSQDSSQIPKASPALRLRSRRSRIRWAKRSAQPDHSQEAPKESEKATQEQETGNAVCESEELFSPSENESPSLLLPHWNLQGQVGKEDTRNQALTLENGGHREENQLCSSSVLLDTTAIPLDTNDGTFSTCLDDNTNKCEGSRNTTETKMETPKQEDDGKRLLDSCTLVEGLLFPAEYYVRTTRRMTVSQSQPDMNAIILSQLSKGRPKRGRGRGRGRDFNRTVSVDAASVSEASKFASDNSSPSPCEFSSGISSSLDGGVRSAAVTPGRGRRGGRRGRGRGRGRTPGRTARLTQEVKENTNVAQVDDISLALSAPKPGVTGEESMRDDDVLDEDKCGAAAETGGEQVRTLNGHSLPPVVLQTNQHYTNGLQKNAGDWPSLLLPSSSQSVAPALSPLPPISLLRSLLGSHVQDFHLPDDQFASLKLLKLRQITADIEPLSPYTTPSRNNNTSFPPLASLSLSPTPDINKTRQQDVSVAPEDNVKLVAKILDLKEEGNIEGEFDDSNQDKVELTCPCPDVFNSMSTQNGKNRTNSSGKRIESCKKISTPDEKSNALEEEILVEGAVDTIELVANNKPEDLALPDVSINSDTDFAEKENQDLESLAHSESQILPKTISVVESSDAHLENNQNVTKKGDLECEKQQLANHPTQLLLSPSLESQSCPLTLPHLGFTPQTTPLRSPRTPRALTHAPARRTVSGPLSPPCPASPASPLGARPPSLPLTPPSHPSQGRCEAPGERGQRGERQPGAAVQRQAEEAKSCTYTLKAPAGGSLVDVCAVPAVPSSSGSVWVAAAGTWAVCLWRSQGHPSQWSLSHTWSFEEPVISVFPVPDAPDLLCVTLGQLEIRQIRVLSCSSLSQSLLCDCVVQTAMGAPGCRVVCFSHTSSTTTIIRVYTLHHSGAPHCLPLVSPGGSLTALASVEGLPDALLGTDDSDSLLIWNMKTGHLLQKVSLGDGLSQSGCIRGFSHGGALFALMQLPSPSSVTEPGEGTGTEDQQQRALFSLLAVNPRNGKCVLAAQLCPPSDWSGRLCEADVLGAGLAALSHRGSVCLWDLERPEDPARSLGAPDGEGWQLARWAGRHLLLTAQSTGDVTLHWGQGTTSAARGEDHSGI